MASLKDIARVAGVSPSLVSRVLSPQPDYRSRCSEETRERILRIAREMNYIPNRAAEFLKRGRSASIGVFLPRIPNRLVADLIFGISEAAAAEGFPLTLSLGQETEQYRRYISCMTKENPCGIITYPFFDNPEVRGMLEEFRRNFGRLVLLNSTALLEPVLCIDDRLGGQLAAQHLLNRGCSAFVCYERHFPRNQGFAETLREAKHEIVEFESQNGMPPDALVDFCRTNKATAPVGVFCVTDYHALRVWRSLQTAGLRIGLDVLLVGYDNLDTADKMDLTTIHQPFYELGKLSVKKLIGLMYGNEEHSQTIAPSIVVRGSA